MFWLLLVNKVKVWKAEDITPIPLMQKNRLSQLNIEMYSIQTEIAYCIKNILK